MPGTFKISFPLPGRRPSSSPQTTPGSQLSSKSDLLDGSPLFHPSPKAEEVLGAPTPDSSMSKKSRTSSSKKDRKKLRNYPSFMSVTLADSDEPEAAKPEEGFPFPGVRSPGVQSPGQTARPPLNGVGQRGSSPLLGAGQVTTTISSDQDYFTAPQSPKLKHGSSLSTLHSFYNKAKSPTSVSQQTSASSARDMALRKGQPHVSSPLTSNPVEVVQPSVPQRTHSRDPSKDSKSSMTKIATTPRRRPTITDPPTLYPNAPRPFHAVSPPSALINSSLPKPMRTGYQPTKSSGKPRWWERRRKPRVSPPAENPEIATQASCTHAADQEGGIASMKTNVRRPQRGAQHWFDGIDPTDESSMDSSYQSEPIDHFGYPTSDPSIYPGISDAPLSISELLAENVAVPLPSIPYQTSSSGEAHLDEIATGTLSSKPDPSNSTPNRSPTQKSSSPYSSGNRGVARSPTNKSIRSNESSRGIPMGLDLQMQSVLHLSSSEDESDDLSSHGHRMRPAMERPEYSSEATIGNASRHQSSKSRPVYSQRSSRRSSHRRSESPEAVPPVPQIPMRNRVRPPVARRTSSKRWQAPRSDATSPYDDHPFTCISNIVNSFPGVDPTMVGTVSTPSSIGEMLPNVGDMRPGAALRRSSKLMKVTNEEESLLSAMREKRASIRAADFQNGFNSAMQLHVQEDLSRPRTSGADGRISRNSLAGGGGGGRYGSAGARGSVCIADLHADAPLSLAPTVYKPSPSYHQYSPAPLSRSNYGYESTYGKTNPTSNRASASADDLTSDDSAYPFPVVPSEPLNMTFHRSPSNAAKSDASPALSFSMSDMLPSIPSSHNSPLTPPPGWKNLNGSSPTRSHMLGMGTGKSGLMGSSGGNRMEHPKGHERHGTGSSSVVMLDGAEQYAAKFDEENEVAGWGIDRW